MGSIDSQLAVIIAEKTAFSTEQDVLASFTQKNCFPALLMTEKNDIYHRYQASQASGELPHHSEAKLTLIFPATEVHVRKYSQQSLRMVTETPAIYREHVLPYVESQRGEQRLGWVYNILNKKAEEKLIIIENSDPNEGYILLPDR